MDPEIQNGGNEPEVHVKHLSTACVRDSNDILMAIRHLWF